MNELLLSIAAQAKEHATTRHLLSGIVLSVNSALFEQKFAELIVQECTTVVAKTHKVLQALPHAIS